jgi:transposase-like protein
VSILVANCVSEDRRRKIIGAEGGMKEERKSWRTFFVWLKERGLAGIHLIINDKCLWMLESVPEVFPEQSIKDVWFTSIEIYFRSLLVIR